MASVTALAHGAGRGVLRNRNASKATFNELGIAEGAHDTIRPIAATGGRAIVGVAFGTAWLGFARGYVKR